MIKRKGVEMNRRSFLKSAGVSVPALMVLPHLSPLSPLSKRKCPLNDIDNIIKDLKKQSYLGRFQINKVIVPYNYETEVLSITGVKSTEDNYFVTYKYDRDYYIPYYMRYQYFTDLKTTQKHLGEIEDQMKKGRRYNGEFSSYIKYLNIFVTERYPDKIGYSFSQDKGVRLVTGMLGKTIRHMNHIDF